MKKMILVILSAIFCLAFASCEVGSSSVKGGQKKITFEQTGYDSVVIYVDEGADLINIPAPKKIDGYTVRWNVQNFENITEDLLVKAIVTPNEYKIYYSIGDGFGASVSASYTSVTFGEQFELLAPTCPGYKFAGWVIKDTETVFVSGDSYEVVGDTYLVATWKPADEYVNPFL